MRRFSGTEIGGMILAALLILGGLDLILWARPEFVPQFTNAEFGSHRKNSVQFIGPAGERVLGVLAVVFGVLVGAFTIYRDKE